MRQLIKLALHVLTVTGAALFAALIALAVALYAAGIATNAKMRDIAKVIDGKLQSPPEEEQAGAADAKAEARITDEQELQQAIAAWQAERKAEEEALSARKDAVETMMRELDGVRAEIDAKNDDFRKRVAAFEAAKAAEEAAANDLAFQDRVKTYAAMDAKDVGPILNGLEDGVVVRYLKAFKPGFRGEVLVEIRKLDEAGQIPSNRAGKLVELMGGGPAEVAANATGAVAQ